MKFDDLKRQGLLSKANTELTISSEGKSPFSPNYLKDITTILATSPGNSVVSLHLEGITNNLIMKEFLEELASARTNVKILTLNNCTYPLMFSEDALSRLLQAGGQLNEIKILGTDIREESIRRNKEHLEKTLQSLLGVLDKWKGHIDLSAYPLNQSFVKGLKQAIENNRHLTVTLNAQCNLSGVFWEDKASLAKLDGFATVPEFDMEDGKYLIDEITKLSNKNRERAEFEKKYREKYEVKTLLKPQGKRPLDVGAPTPSVEPAFTGPPNKMMRPAM